MSIKSHKSLNEECSEIWERSYSVRSGSDEDLSSHSSEDETDHLVRVLLTAMTPAVLGRLRRRFHKGAPRTLKDVAKRVEKVMLAAAASEGVTFAAAEPREHGLWIDEPTFIKALADIFGHHKYSVHAHKLYQSLDPFCSRKASWDSLLDRLVAVGARKTRSRADVWKNVGDGKMKQMGHCMRETIVKLVSIVTEDSFCFAAVSRGGRIGLYDGELKLLHQYQLWYHRKGISHRVKNCWVTDAVYLPDALCLCIAASDRSLTIYDASTLGHTPLFCVTSLPNIPTCLAYEPSNTRHSSSELIIGDERGDIYRITFLQPRVSLLYKQFADRINCCYWMELSSPPHDIYCTLVHWPRVHSRSIRRLYYSRPHDAVVSCSLDSRTSVAVRHRAGKIDDYVFSVVRGVTCFHMVSKLQLLATGSPDGVVRLWTRGVANPTAALLCSGRTAVVDVAVLTELEGVTCFHIISKLQLLATGSPDGVVRLWTRGVANPTAALLCSGRTAVVDVAVLTELEGVTCFHMVSKLQLLATGSPDGVVRLWTRGVANPTAALLCSGSTAVVDVAVLTELEVVVAYCKNCWIDIFDLYEECLLQTIKIRFPFLGVLGKKVEFGAFCIHPGPIRKSAEEDSDSPTSFLDQHSSRYGSNVCNHLNEFKDPHNFSSPELIITCCDYTYSVKIGDVTNPVLPPPGGTRRARRPSFWDLSEHDLEDEPPPSSHRSPRPIPLSASPRDEEAVDFDLDVMLDNAGLEGILEKDFVLMMGLKHDLNKKIADLQADMGNIWSRVSIGAPYLAVKLHDPVDQVYPDPL